MLGVPLRKSPRGVFFMNGSKISPGIQYGSTVSRHFIARWGIGVFLFLMLPLSFIFSCMEHPPGLLPGLKFCINQWYSILCQMLTFPRLLISNLELPIYQKVVRNSTYYNTLLQYQRYAPALLIASSNSRISSFGLCLDAEEAMSCSCFFTRV